MRFAVVNGEEGKESVKTFRWKHPRRAFFETTKPLFVSPPLFLMPECQDGDDQVGADHVLHVRKLYAEVPCRGWGSLLPIVPFIRRLAENNVMSTTIISESQIASEREARWKIEGARLRELLRT